MMLRLAKLGIAMAVLVVLIAPAAYAGVPDVSKSFFVPQGGPLTTPCEGAAFTGPAATCQGIAGTPWPGPHVTGGAVGLARTCPDNDGIQVLRNWARLKVVVIASDNTPIANIPAADICALFNGGTTAQGFSGLGADSIQADPSISGAGNICPAIRCVQADAPTDANGTTFITWIGHLATDPPGAGTRDPNRKWGGFDSDIPVMVLGYKLQGRLTTGGAPGSYKAIVRNYDTTPFLPPISGASEKVTLPDFNAVNSGLTSAYNYKLDFDGNGVVGLGDFNQLNGGHFSNVASQLHNCSFPLAN